MTATVYTADAALAVPALDPGSVHLTVTSPPYDSMRDYKGEWSIDLPKLGVDLLRATADGGFCAMVIQDGTKDFAKSLTTFRTAVAWCDAGWRLFECVIWRRSGTPGKFKRFRVDHEYVLIFLKGNRPRCFEKEHTKEPAIYAGTMQHGATRNRDRSHNPMQKKLVADTKCRGTVWNIPSSRTERKGIKFQHPATFPQALARDLILCFSQPGDVVFDPFVGSGTTVIEAAKHGRIGRGCDISPEYVGLARRRLAEEIPQTIGDK